MFVGKEIINGMCKNMTFVVQVCWLPWQPVYVFKKCEPSISLAPDINNAQSLCGKAKLFLLMDVIYI